MREILEREDVQEGLANEILGRFIHEPDDYEALAFLQDIEVEFTEEDDDDA
jgi:hypothetical protein